MAPASAAVGQAHPCDPHPVVTGSEDDGLLVEAVAGVPAEAVAETMPHLVVGGLRRGPGERRPEGSRLFIADVESLAVRIEHRVVVPGGQAVFAAILAPGVTGAGLADQEPEALVRHHVDPGTGGSEES
jgi:hypothetical protein